jgi:hypothetical protein
MAHVQDTQADNSASGASLAVSSLSVTAGNRIVVVVGCEDFDNSITVTDGGVNSYSLVSGAQVNDSGDNFATRMFTAIAATTASITVQANYSPNAAFRAIWVGEYSVPGDLDSGSDTALRQTTGTTRNAGSFTNSGDGDHVAVCIDIVQNATPTAGGGFTGRGGMWAWGGTNAALPEDASITGTGTQSATWGTDTAAVSHAVQAFFLASGGGGGGGGFTVRRQVITSLRPAAFAPGLGR